MLSWLAPSFPQLFSGIVISLSIIPEFLAWIQYVSIYGYVVQVRLYTDCFSAAKICPYSAICMKFCVSFFFIYDQSLAINEISGVFYNATPVNISGKLVWQVHACDWAHALYLYVYVLTYYIMTYYFLNVYLFFRICI